MIDRQTLTPESPVEPVNAILPTRVGGLADRKYEILAKRVVDFLASALLVLVLSPLLLLLAILVWLIDGGPILYRRRVVGINGNAFDAYKFRTMVPDADAFLAASPELRDLFTKQFKLKSDPRVTKFGAWLRKYSLDELPQLWNVLRGQMSLVGPRMITAEELHKYGPHGQLLLTVKPGLTGYWQVRGRQDVSYERRVEMDIYYITHWNLYLDITILLQTPAKVIRREGAY
jgi:lipopolysaccharide/colanic/teichoic acid biosynthesis glycosyltransferase